MNKRTSPSLRAMYEVLQRDPDFWLRGAVSELQRSGNPYYVWMAIGVCIKHNKLFPEWILAYLGDCADRILSDQAREARDLRKVLPWALGFPSLFNHAQRKSGPGNLLNPEGPDRSMFALRFAIRLEEGEKPLDALRNAYNDAFETNDNADEKTLKHWLCKEYNLTKWTSSADNWKAICRQHHTSYWNFLEENWEKSRETLT
jgi:hypothetical protein